jgi:hypothetical protein
MKAVYLLIVWRVRKRFIGSTADLTMCITYFEVGRMIVEEEQCGKARAEYGKNLLAELSAYLNKRVGKGFSVSTLTNARKFYNVYAFSISQAMLSQLYPFNLSWPHLGVILYEVIRKNSKNDKTLLNL